MVVYQLWIDDTGSTWSHEHSWGLFSTREKAEAYVKTLDWWKEWMGYRIEEVEVL